MLSVFHILYFSSLLTATVFAYLSFKKGNKAFVYILLMSALALLTEGIEIPIEHYRIHGFGFIMHIFNLFEYSLFCMYYIASCQNNHYKWLVRTSMVAYVVFWCYASIFIQHLRGVPTLNINVEGFLLFIIYCHLLFSIDAHSDLRIFDHPDFWISVGVLSYFGGVFAFFCMYQAMLHIYNADTRNLFGLITDPLNLILYSGTTIGLLCSIRNKRYLIASR